MTPVANRYPLIRQLGVLLRISGAAPRRWVITTVAASVALAALDMAGVAAMIPLMQLITTGAADGAVLSWTAGVLGTDSLSVMIPVISGFVVLAFLVKTAGSLVFRWWLLGRTNRVTALAAAELMNRYVLAPYAAHRTRSLSVLYRNVNDATNQAASVLLALVTLCSDVLVLVAIMLVLALASPLVTLFAATLFGALVFGVQRMLRKRQLRLGEEAAEAGLEAWQALLPGLEGFRETRLTSSASTFVGRFRSARVRGAHIGREIGFISDVPRYLLEVVFIVAVAGIAGLLFLLGQGNEIIAVLGLFAAASMRALPTMNRVSASVAIMRAGQAGLRIVVDAMSELDSEGMHDEVARSVTPFSGDIVLSDVSFAYADGETAVIEDLSLIIRENQTTAFTGGSGAGKTTLVDLVLGLLSPQQGRISCGGRDIEDDLASWYAGIGVVPQDVFLLNATLLENITFGEAAEKIDLARVHDAVSQAELTDVIATLADGLETIVGDRGLRLSGGQRQRVGLARALYRRPKLLVLDEATSALDNATEHRIAETLNSLRGQMTIVIVAHRLSTVRSVDHLVHLREGRIAAQGTFDGVRAQDSEFARLVELGRLE